MSVSTAGWSSVDDGEQGDEDEAGEAESAHPEAVDDHVEHDLPGEDAGFAVVRWANHHVGRSADHAEAHVGEAARDEDDPL